jgi:nicotinamidase-related amidase
VPAPGTITDSIVHPKGGTMSNDLGVWKAEDCALLLIDYQKEMFEVIRSEASADLVEMHVRLLAKTAKAYDVPIVLSTVGVAAGFNSPTIPSLLAELDRSSRAFSVIRPSASGSSTSRSASSAGSTCCSTSPGGRTSASSRT